MLNIKFALAPVVAMVATLCFSQPSDAQTFVGTITQAKGDVKILKKASASASGKKVVFEGQSYTYKKARVGRKIRPHQVVMSGPKAQAKIVYSNGDQLAIGPGTSVVVPSLSGKADKSNKPSLNLFYGKIRAMVSKNGPRKELKMKTKSAVAGVRGTDFYLSHHGEKGTQVTVMRGAVEVSKAPGKKHPATATKPTIVKPGFSASIKKAAETAEGKKTAAAPAPLVAQATKEQLLEVQKVSTIKMDASELKKLDQQISEEIKKEVSELNEKSKVAVMEDIKAEDPKLYEEIKSKKITDVDKMNTVIVSNLYKEAPREKAPHKPEFKEIEVLGEDVYKKYFDVND